MPNESYPIASLDYLRERTLAQIESQNFLFLGQIIEWIISLGQPVSSMVMVERWDDAERELFDFLDAGSSDVQGYPAPDRPRVHESLPRGIWARMNKGGRDDPWFSPVDDSEEREDGGSVYVGDQKWDGVRLPMNVVLNRWPPTDIAEGEARADGERSHIRNGTMPPLGYLRRLVFGGMAKAKG